MIRRAFVEIVFDERRLPRDYPGRKDGLWTAHYLEERIKFRFITNAGPLKAAEVTVLMLEDVACPS